MTLRSGLRALIGLSGLGVAVAWLLVFTCPFGAQLAFIARVHQAPMAQHGEHAEPEHETGKAEHPEAGHPEAARQPRGAPAEPGEGKHGFAVHLMVVPGVRGYPVVETKLLSLEVSWLGIVVLLVVMALCWLILRQRSWRLLGYTVSPKAMGAAVLALTLWDLLFALWLLAVEVVQFQELCLT
jgi:hypothetical protein